VAGSLPLISVYVTGLSSWDTYSWSPEPVLLGRPPGEERNTQTMAVPAIPAVALGCHLGDTSPSRCHVEQWNGPAELPQHTKP
jgi:hypothetical protein